MSNLFKLTLEGILIEVVAVLSFIGIAKTSWDFPGKQVVIIMALIAIIVFFIVAVARLSIRELFYLSAFLTIGIICIYQVLGFSFFPGIVKDVVPFSWEHLSNIGFVTLLVFCGHMGIVILIIGFKKILKL